MKLYMIIIYTRIIALPLPPCAPSHWPTFNLEFNLQLIVVISKVAAILTRETCSLPLFTAFELNIIVAHKSQGFVNLLLFWTIN